MVKHRIWWRNRHYRNGNTHLIWSSISCTLYCLYLFILTITRSALWLYPILLIKSPSPLVYRLKKHTIKSNQYGMQVCNPWKIVCLQCSGAYILLLVSENEIVLMQVSQWSDVELKACDWSEFKDSLRFIFVLLKYKIYA